MINRGPVLTPENIYQWLQENHPSPDEIQDLIEKCRRENFTDNLRQDNSIHTLCYAVMIHNLRHVSRTSLRKLLTDLSVDPTDDKQKKLPAGDIIILITEAIKLIMFLVDQLKNCKKPKNNEAILEILRHTNNNPFLNLPKISLHAELPNAKLRYANFTKADLSNSNLSGADLSRANLTGANLSNTNLIGAQINYSTLRWANLTGAKIDEINVNKLGLYNFLTNNYPKDVQLANVPHPDEIDYVLKALHIESEADNYLAHKTKNRIKQSLDHDHQRRMVAENIVNKLSHMIDEKAREEFLKKYREHPYFQDNTTAKLAKGVNSVLVHAAHLFGKTHVDPIVGNGAQRIFDREIERCHHTQRVALR